MKEIKATKTIDSTIRIMFIISILIGVSLITSFFYNGMDITKVNIYGWKINRGVGESMLPTIEDNSLLVIRVVDTDKIRVGDVIVYKIEVEGGMGIVHRVVDINSEGFTTMGDGNYGYIDEYIVYPEDILGVVKYSIKDFKINKII